MTLLEDVLVLDCASFVAGPAAATIMSDFGARVIKIEPPGAGDSYRQLIKLNGVPLCEQDYFWLLDNRNKESLALDLKQDDGRAILDSLIARADVFITNFPGPIRERLRLRAEDVLPLNERLIYASLTPYGEEGPEKDRTGYDSTAWWARSGLMSAIRPTAQSEPARSIPAMGDHPTSVALFGAIMTALYRREKPARAAKCRHRFSPMDCGRWIVICKPDYAMPSSCRVSSVTIAVRCSKASDAATNAGSCSRSSTR